MDLYGYNNSGNTDDSGTLNTLIEIRNLMKDIKSDVSEIRKDNGSSIKSSLSSQNTGGQIGNASRNINPLMGGMSSVMTTMSDNDREFFKQSFTEITTALKSGSVVQAKDSNSFKKEIISAVGKLGSTLSSALAGISAGGIANSVFNFIKDFIMSDYKVFEQRDAEYNSVMYKYGLSDTEAGKRKADEILNNRLRFKEDPFGSMSTYGRFAPEQRAFERQNRRSAISLGYSTESSVKAVTKELNQWNDLIDMTDSELLDTTMRFIDTTGTAFNDIMEQIQSTSENMVVTPELLKEVSGSYAKYMRTITTNNNSYTKSMNNLIQTVGKLENQGIDSQFFMSDVQNFQYMDVANASQTDTWKRYSVFGYNPYEMMTKSPDEALQAEVKGLKDYFAGYDLSNGQDRMQVNTLAQQVLGYSASEMQKIYDVLEGKEVKVEKTNEEKISDFTENYWLNYEEYHENYLSQFTHVTESARRTNEELLNTLTSEEAKKVWEGFSDLFDNVSELKMKLADTFREGFYDFVADGLNWLNDTGFPWLETNADKILNTIDETIPKVVDSVNAIYEFLTGKGEVAQTGKEVGSTFSLLGKGIGEGVSSGDWSMLHDLFLDADASNEMLAKEMGYENFKDYSENSKGFFVNLYNKLNGFATGIDYVPHDDYIARLHKGEKVLNASDSRHNDKMTKDLTDSIEVSSASNLKLNNTLTEQFSKNKQGNVFSVLMDSVKNMMADTKATNDLQKSISGSKGLNKINEDLGESASGILDLLSGLFKYDKDTKGYQLNLTGLTSQEDTGGTYNPFSSYNITSKYGMRRRNGKLENHKGVDYGIPIGTGLEALDAGIILDANSNSQYGNYIDLQGDNGYTYRYAHLNQMNYKKGDTVTRGSIIGTSGNSGSSTGPHLHLEITDPNNKYMDPLKYFSSNIRTTGSNGLLNQLSSLFGLKGSFSGADADENAKYVYSYFKGMGMSDENIAGILGNWMVESGVDPTTIEGYYTDKYQMSPAKLGFSKDLNNYTLNTLFPKYAGRVSINKNGYKATDGLYYPGLGLGQWTGGRAKLLLDTASGNWYDLSSQLDFMTGPDSRSSWIKNWINNPAKTPEEAAYKFLAEWEGIVNGTQGQRQTYAKQFYEKMKDWDVGAIPQGGSFLSQLASLFGGLGATGKRADVINFAKSKIGTPYVWGAAGPNGYDCSGLVSAALNSVGLAGAGHSLSTAGMRGNVINISSLDQIQAGDILMGNHGKHTGIYIGDGKVIHASGPGGKYNKVIQSDWNSGWYAKWNGLDTGAYALGGEIKSPTMSLLGEGGHKEYVISTDPKLATRSKNLLNKAYQEVSATTAGIPSLSIDFDSKPIVDAVEVLTEVVKDGFRIVKSLINEEVKVTTKTAQQSANLITDYV